MSNDPISINPDDELSSHLQKNFTQRACIDALLQAATTMARAVGVTVTWNIESVDEDTIVDRTALAAALGKMTTATGAMLVGGKINPIKVLSEQDPMKILREKQ
jgi:hypothetical protein